MKITKLEALSDKYKVKKQVSRGGFSTVFLAHELSSGRSCAIKTIKSKVKERTVFNEVEICNKLSGNSGIVKIRDLCLISGTYHIIFEYVRGKNIISYFSNRKASVPICKSIGRQLAKILKYCHANNIVHRDVKPKNILMSEGGRIKLADFGLSVDLTNNNDNDNNKGGRLKGLCGSINYISPEILTSASYDKRIDVWGYGVTMHFIISSKRLFPGTTRQDIIKNIKNKNYSIITKSKNEEDFFMGIIEYDPDDRLSWDDILGKQYLRS